MQNTRSRTAGSAEFAARERVLDDALVDMRDIVERLWRWGWIDTTGGSLSVRMPGDPQSFAMTPTHSGFRRWRLDGLTVVDERLERLPDSSSDRPVHPSAIVHLHLYRRIPRVRAVVHAHSPHTLAFACAGRDLKPLTLQSQMLGVVPCLESDVDRAVPGRHRATLHERERRFTSAVEGYGYAMEHFADLLGKLDSTVVPRAQELERHGLAFLVYKHGIFVVARTLSEGFDNLVRAERNAQVQLLGSPQGS